VGTRFVKAFEGFGVFGGEVLEVHDEVQVLYRVKYEDGDVEDLTHAELRSLVANPPTAAAKQETKPTKKPAKMARAKAKK
jgi:hypothetical protein